MQVFLKFAAVLALVELSLASNVRDLKLRWTDQIVPYQFVNLNTTERALVLEAIDEMESKTCLDFVERTDEIDFIRFVQNGPGCTSAVGRTGGPQEINLAPVCFDAGNGFGTALHQLGHVIGLIHEHNRPDRNKFVQVRKFLIDPAFAPFGFYNLELDDDASSQGLPYDYGSIMHFRVDAFAKPNKEVLFIKRPFSGEIGQRVRLSDTDAEAINRFYGCPTKGLTGRLRFRFKEARNIAGDVPAYAIVVAFKSNGERIFRRTALTSKVDGKFRFFENFDLGVATWSFYRVAVRFGSGEGQSYTLAETFTAVKGFRNQRHCNAPERRRCNRGLLTFNTNFT